MKANIQELAEEFVFKSYSVDWNTGELICVYEIVMTNDEVKTFSETLTLAPLVHDIPKDKQNYIKLLLQGLFLALGTSYYKLYCPKRIRLESVSLDKNQAKFWNSVYTEGLGEFYYKNNIDYRNLANFPVSEKKIPNAHKVEHVAHKKEDVKALVPIGGGKDSIVTIELLKEANVEFDLFSLKTSPVQEAVAHIIGKKIHVVSRSLDPAMLQLAKSGEVYNGHIPISTIYMFTALLYAAVYGYTDVIFSNERSSDYGNVEYYGNMINHQWSKSKKFEDMIRTYTMGYNKDGVNIYSLLRPLYEIKITKIFSQYNQYFEAFSSSNHNFRIQSKGVKKELDRWDYRSPKTLFVYAMLAAFVSKQDIMRIFGKDLYDDEAHVSTFRELLGVNDIKPFDCVGTPDEMVVAMHMAYQNGEYADTPAMNMFEASVLPNVQDISVLRKQVMSYGNDENIPSYMKSVVKNA